MNSKGGAVEAGAGAAQKEAQTKIEGMKAVATTLVIIYALIGGALVILSASLNHIDPALKLSYKDYLEQMAIAAGALSIGRGLVANAKANAAS
jgi:hypothetical protein